MRSRTRSMSRYFRIKFTITTLYCFCLVLQVDTQSIYVPNSRCPANMYGQECYQCDDSTVIADGVCQNCPAGSTSPAGSVYLTNCVCGNGLYRTFKIPPDQLGTTNVLAFECLPVVNLCAANFYRTGGVCFPCPAYSTGSPGIESLTDCMCNKGYSTSKITDDPTLLRPYFQCTQCQAGKYAQPFYEKCESCPTASYSNAGGILSDCVCQGGYSGQNGGLCTGCLPGKYSGGGPTPCVNCPGNSSSLSFASGCLCNKGFSGWDWLACTPCPAGTYKNTLGSTQCSACPANTSSPVMSTSQQDCTCSPGLGKFYLDETSKDWVVTCTVCSRGKYKSVSGDTPCSSCPANTTSPSGSTTIAACVCDTGFSRASGVCLACTAGTYKTLPGNEACTNCSTDEPFMDATRQIQRAQRCQQCRPGTYQSSGDTSCVNCPVNSTSQAGSRSFTDCVCKDGFIGDVNNCTECPTGSYKNTNPTCVDKPGIVKTFEDSKTDWMCVMPSTWQNREGYTTNFISLSSSGCNILCNECCASCRVHGRCKEPLAPACSLCPANSIPALNTCICKAGFAGPNGWNCTACETGKYSNVGQKFCSCNPGLYGLDGGNCTACEPGKFSIGAQTVCTLCEIGKYSTTGTTACSDCPRNSYSTISGATIKECECNPGFSGTGGTCLPCTAGKYKDTLGSACSSCPNQSTSPNGSVTLNDCVCNAGHTCSDVASFETNGYYCKYFEKHPGQCFDYAACSSCCACSLFCADMGVSIRPSGCVSCPVGYNKTSVGPATCSQCPLGQTSTDGLKCVDPNLMTTTPTITTSTTRVITTSTTPAPTSSAVGNVTCTCSRLCQPSTGTRSGIISVNASQYENNMYCSWIIASNGFIGLTFSFFQTESESDFVTINRCTTSSCSTVEKIVDLSGLGQPGAVFTSNTGYMQVVFDTDFSETRPGFIAIWSITTSVTTTTTPVMTTSTTPIRTTTTTPVPTTSTTLVPTSSTTLVMTTSTTPVMTTSTTLISTTSTTPVPTTSTNLIQPTSTTQVSTTTSTPIPTTSATFVPTSSTTPTRTSTTPTQTTSTTPSPTTSRTPAVTSKSNTMTSTPKHTSSIPVRTSSTTPMPTETSTPIPSSSSDIFIIIGIIASMLFLICCCLVWFILCFIARKNRSSLEYDQLEAQKQARR